MWWERECASSAASSGSDCLIAEVAPPCSISGLGTWKFAAMSQSRVSVRRISRRCVRA
jgi:hypothetical protein